MINISEYKDFLELAKIKKQDLITAIMYIVTPFMWKSGYTRSLPRIEYLRIYIMPDRKILKDSEVIHSCTYTVGNIEFDGFTNSKSLIAPGSDRNLVQIPLEDLEIEQLLSLYEWMLDNTDLFTI